MELDRKISYFLGLIRDFLRGGKPDFYFYGRSGLSFNEIKKVMKTIEGKDETLGIKGIEFHSDNLKSDENSRLAFCQRVIKGLEDVGKEANLTLITGLILCCRRFMEFIG